MRLPVARALPEGDLTAPLVLVVEDNRDMNAFLSESLATHNRLERAFGGVEGLQRAKERRPDIAVTDVTGWPRGSRGRSWSTVSGDRPRDSRR